MKHILLAFFFFSSLNAQITLTHNVGDVPIQTDMVSCSGSQSWARIFALSDFGISTNNKFVINSGQVALYNSLGGSSLQFNIYKADDSFPYSYSRTNLIGSSQVIRIPVIGEDPEIIQVDFDTPVVIPDGVERVLVEARRLYDVNRRDTAQVYIAGTEEENDTSWYWGCGPVYVHTPTENLSPPTDKANFFINVTGSLFDAKSLGLETTLTHNPCNDAVWVNQYSCSWGGLKYGRTFVLKDFGVSENEEFVIDKGQVAFSSVGVYDVKIQFNIYKIDDNFPDSYSTTDLIGSSQIIYVPYFGSGNRIDAKVFEILFGTPIVVPADVDEILVEVFNLDSSSSSGLAFIGGGVQSEGLSWLRSEASGCPPFREYQAVTNPDINYFINVTGNTKHVTNNFEMNISNVCSEFLKEFSVENKANIASVIWNFGDPVSGADNTSTDLSPYHDFSADGTYTITATVVGNDGSVEVLTETIDVKEPPNAYGISNIYACEDNFNTGISSSFDVSMVEQQVLGGQIDKIITFIDGSGNEYNTLPNTFTNTIRDRETINVRVSHKDNPCCSSEITFDLIVNPLSDLESVENLFVCESVTNGFATFNLLQIESDVIGVSANMDVEFYHENGQKILTPLNVIENLIVNEETITVKAINTDTNCYNETTFKLIVNSLPIANTLNELIGCDDNNDGVSEYFDTSNVEFEVLDNQTNVEVSYFDVNGNQLVSPLSNPYTNSIRNEEVITVRVTNPLTTCYAETPLILKTASQPYINKPQTIYACDLGNGFASFDTSNIEYELIGVQNGLKITYLDANGNQLQSPFPVSFQNTKAWSQTIFVRVENELNSLCYSETSFDLIVNELPQINLDNEYFLCDLEPSLDLLLNGSFDSWKWTFQDGTIISNTFEANLINAGNYKLKVSEINNGISCENTFDFELIRSTLPSILEVKKEDFSDDNFVEIVASGDGDFEYSLDGISYQTSPIFENVQGGIYTASVRDIFGCGEDFYGVTILDYPKYFTPNNDGLNDFWQIKGIENSINPRIYIYDRYGKLLKQLNPNGLGWDGTYNGQSMPNSDYWFTLSLENEKHVTGHFSLKR